MKILVVDDDRELRELIEGHRFTIANMSYHLVRHGCCFEYRMTVRTLDSFGNLVNFAEKW